MHRRFAHSRGSAHDVFRARRAFGGLGRSGKPHAKSYEIARNRTKTDRALSYECAFARLRTLSPGVPKEVQASKNINSYEIVRNRSKSYDCLCGNKKSYNGVSKK